ncbi:hypothetical protein BJY04DRAFT_108804 [Aspergillus karnatakaensis]|uniref:uncharacterized protein n=1 Tax=Aspergillus karnatakaensis TaxID=1810916 RepID=UPI003CCDF3D0
MRIISPQSATLTNIEVLSFLSSNPPRRPPNPPPGVNQKHWIPSPDLRDHNTVVKEIHNYATRLSPHLLRYPQYVSPTEDHSAVNANGKGKTKGKKATKAASNTETAQDALETALRDLITRLQPYGLTKGEVLMIVNLGVGIPPAEGTNGGGAERGGDQMDVDAQDSGENGAEGAEGEEVVGQANGEGEGEGAEEEGEQGDYGALALIDTVIEEREQRLNDDDVLEILNIIRETLGSATA